MSDQLFFINDNTAEYGAGELNGLATRILSEGVLNSQGTDWEDFADGDLKVVEHDPTPNMTVDVAVGEAIIEHTRGGETFKAIARITNARNLAVPANATGGNRIDAVVISVDQDATLDILGAGAVNVEYITNTTGTPTVAMTDGDIDTYFSGLTENKDWIRLADITVANGASSVLNAGITDTRTRATIGNEITGDKTTVQQFNVFTSDPDTDLLTAGMLWYNTTNEAFMYYDGTNIQQISKTTPGAAGLSTDDLYSSEFAQSHTTKNTVIEVGEADATGRRKQIEWSFVADRSTIKGFVLGKEADTGSFTGTVTIALHEDNGGSPDAVAVASVTISNAAWLLMASAQPFYKFFSSEYTMNAGQTYWGVITTSTSSNANHPNFSVDNTGSYSGGVLKYWNTTDGHVLFAGTDMYFKVVNGRVNKVPYTNGDGEVFGDILNPFQKMVGVTPYLAGDWVVIHRRLTHNGYQPSNGTTNTQLWISSSGMYDGFAHLTTSADYCNGSGPGVHSGASLFWGFITGTSAEAQFSDLVTQATKLVLEWPVILHDLTDGEFAMGLGENGVLTTPVNYNVGANGRDFVGVVFRSNGNIYLQTSTSTNVTATLAVGTKLPKIPFGTKKAVRVRIEFDAGVQARLYIDGELVASHSTNLPNNAGNHIQLAYTFNEITAGTVRASLFSPTLAVKITP